MNLLAMKHCVEVLNREIEMAIEKEDNIHEKKAIKSLIAELSMYVKGEY